jgi:uncharacterized protein (UPF0333 family)
MKHLRNKGQGAMEYLMTYGWAILVVMIVGVVLWQLGVFSSGTKNTVTTGFAKMQPLGPSIAYKGTNFTASFTNAIGTAIKLTGVTLNETIAGNSTSNCTTTIATQSIPAGGSFTVSSDNCPEKLDGEAYDVLVRITYSATLGGISTEHVDTGHIKGVGEAV